MSIAMKMQGRKKVSARTLAEEFQVSERTIYRDLGILSGAGIPYEYSRDYGYRILPGYYLPPLMFTTQQAAALLMGAEFIKLRSDASINREANEAADKIRAVLPETVLQHIDELIDRTSLDPYWLHQVPTNEYFSKLSDAIVQRRTVWIEYFVGSRKEVTRRQVDPLGLVFYTDHWNLVAFDHLRRDIRQFALEYIQEMDVLTRRFTSPEGFVLKSYLQEHGASFGSARIVLRFAASTYKAARSSIPALLEDEKHEEEYVTVSFRFDNMAYLSRYVLRFGDKIEVLKPRVLQEYVRALALRVAGHYALPQSVKS